MMHSHQHPGRILFYVAHMLIFALGLCNTLLPAMAQSDNKPAIVTAASSLNVGEFRRLQVTIGGQPATMTQLQRVTFTPASGADFIQLGMNDGTLTGLKPGMAQITATYKPDANTSVSSEVYSVTVIPSLQITFAKGTLVLGDTLTAEVNILRTYGQPYEPLKAEERKRLVFQSSKPDVATITQQSGQVRAVATGTTDITATLVTDINSPPSISNPAPLSVGSVNRFAKLTALAHIMDDTTAAELFGHNTSDGFYVVQITLRNDLDSHETVLAFADTLAVSVVMEKKYVGGRHASTDITPTKGWTLVTEADFAGTFSASQFAALPAGAFSDINLFPASMTLGKGQMLSFKAVDRQGNQITNMRWSSQYPQVATVDPATGEVTGISAGQTNILASTGTGTSVQALVRVLAPGQVSPHAFLYYPYTFQVVADASFIRFDRLRQTSPFSYASALGTVVSFFTAADVLRGTVATTVLDKYSNLLLPGLQRLFPSHADAESSNIVKHTMKQVEEVPFGSTTTRMLFFPKRQVKGLLRGYSTRIAAIYVDRAQIDVATITQTQTVQAKPSLAPAGSGNTP